MDYLSHPLSGQSQAAHHQPNLHRSSRPSAVRSQGRLPRRIERRILSIAPRQIFEDIYVPLLASETPAQNESPEQLRIPPQYETRRTGRNAEAARNRAATRDPHPLAPAPPDPQISPTLPRPPEPHPRPSLPLNHLRSPRGILLTTEHWPLTTALVENQSLTPAPSPSLLEIQPMVFPS